MLIRSIRHAAALATAVLAASLLSLACVTAKDEAKPGVLARGEKLQGLREVKLAELVAAPDRYVGQSVRLDGTVRRACAKMGCWMELAESAAPEAAGVRVVMKGHAFFVPTDSAGSRATVEGAVTVETLDAEEAHHLESEGGTVAKGADGKAREVHVEATGVELVRS